MAFSLRKMLSNINYFKKPGEEGPEDEPGHVQRPRTSTNIPCERTEPDSTSKQCATSLKLPDSLKNYAAKKGSLSDTDILTVSKESSPKKGRKKSKKLKLDVKKASKSTDNIDQSDSSNNVENTPKHILLDINSEDLFSQRFRHFDFDRSFDLFDHMSDEELRNEKMDIESFSEHSDTDISLVSDYEKEDIKMCRKVDPDCEEDVLAPRPLPSATPESFGDVELEKDEEERISLLLNYQTKLEKVECLLKKLLSEFQFHADVSKIFLCKSMITTLPGTDDSTITKPGMSNDRGVSPSWNIVTEKEDVVMKSKVKKQLLSMRQSIDQFIAEYLDNDTEEPKKAHRLCRNITFDVKQKCQKKKQSNKKKFRHFDFPDYREAMLNLFEPENREDLSVSGNNITLLLSDVESECSKCGCSCHNHSPSSEIDSGMTMKNESMSSQSITSSIGNFTLDTSTLTAYSESLDLIVSYNSFQDTSLYSTILQKAAIERITFYVQVHSIQLNCETSEEFESKNVITFYCPACKIIEKEENGLLKHILSQYHCEKIHFLYKTAYIKKCVAVGKEIMPSTVLNPMKMYRDDNKVVCFGDAMYACSLCFENLIMGESVLMAHCSQAEHIDRRERLCDILE